MFKVKLKKPTKNKKLRLKLKPIQNFSDSSYWVIIQELCEVCGNHMKLNHINNSKKCSFINCKGA